MIGAVELRSVTGPHKPLVAGSNPSAATSLLIPTLNPNCHCERSQASWQSRASRGVPEYLKMMTNRYCQAVGCYDAVETHRLYSPVDNIKV